jgi:hypothetical protein
MKKLFLTLVMICAGAQAQTSVNFSELTREAFDLYPVKLEYSAPRIERIADRELQQWLCRGECGENMFPRGVYYQHTIYLNDNITDWDDYSKSLYVHEVVHYLQDLSGKTNKHGAESCESHMRLEQEAYDIQNAWLKKRHSRIRLPMMELVRASSKNSCSNQMNRLSKQ